MHIFYIVNVPILHIVNVQVYDQWYEARNPKFLVKLRKRARCTETEVLVKLR